MCRERQDQHEDETAAVRERGDQKGVRAAGSIATAEVAGSPAQSRNQAEADRHELFGGRQSGFASDHESSTR